MMSIKTEDGWKCYGVTYTNCDEIPHWHKEPLVLCDDEVDVCLRLRCGEKK